MRLEDSLEVEGEAVPKSELAACRASHYTPSFRSPLNEIVSFKVCHSHQESATDRYAIYWTTYLVSGRVDELGA